MNTLVDRSGRLWAYLQLMRPANIVTALADVLAGFAASGLVLYWGGYPEFGGLVSLSWLLLATAALYAGGVVFNDIFDADLDRRERPERPIPSGRASRRSAALLGALLLCAGVVAAWQASGVSAVLAVTIALMALSYDALTKHHAWLGPVNMGACRGFNLLLGVSAAPAMVTKLWFLALIPLLYIGAVTTMARGEVHGGRRRPGIIMLLLIAATSSGLFALAPITDFECLTAMPFLALLLGLIVPSIVRAIQRPHPPEIRAAVKTCIIMLIVLNATIAAGFAGVGLGLLVLSLLPISIGLSRLFAVT